MTDSLLVLTVMTGITLASRLLPFLLFSRDRAPRWLADVETVLPPLVLWLLVFYSLGGVVWRNPPYGIPALTGIAVTVLLHRRKHETLISIISGTAVYMILTRLLA